MITVLRLGHRIERDKRLSTHVALSARALGCSAILYSGEKDEVMEKSVSDVVANWGGLFSIKHVSDWRRQIKDFKGITVHLTMYGIPVQDKIKEIRKKRNVMVIVGGEKVPPEVYQEADYNIAVASQPHSEVAALALLLDGYFQGKELEKRFSNARRKIVPQERGKRVIGK